MKLAVFGGTTHIDQHFLKHALRSGYSIHFLGTQTPEVRTANCVVLQGGTDDTALVEQTLQDAHAVISLPYAIADLKALAAVVQAMYAYGISRLIVAADLYQTDPRDFEKLLKQAGIDWTIVQLTPMSENNKTFGVSAQGVARYLVKQITDVANVRSALLLSN